MSELKKSTIPATPGKFSVKLPKVPELEFKPADSDTTLKSIINLAEYIRDDLPYPQEQVKRIEFFYKKRERDRNRFKPTATGDLAIHSKSGEVEETIRLLTYVPHDPAVRENMDQTRLDAIGFAESQYEDALLVLRQAMTDYRRIGTLQPVVAAQKAVAEADQVLSRVRYRTRGIQAMSNPEIRDVFFDQAKEHRKLFSGKEKDPFNKELTRLITLEQPLYTFYGTYVESGPDVDIGQDVDESMEKPIESEGLTRRRLRDGRMARIFFDVEEGPNMFLSPCWPVEFTMDDTRYFTALQAFEAERARTAGQEGLRTNILRTRSTRTMRFLTKKFETQPKDVKGLWLRIFTAIYQQHSELKEKLLNTGTDALVFADVRQGPSGAGFGEQSKEILDPARWTGDNALGLALETLRYQFREGTAKESSKTDAPNESVITKEEQDKAKVGAIIQAKKFFPKRPPGV